MPAPDARAAPSCGSWPGQLLDDCPWLVLQFRPEDLALTFVSDNAADVLGYHASELVALDTFWEQVVHPDDGSRIRDACRRALAATSSSIDHDCRLRARDGRYRWFRASMRMRYDEQARAISMFAYVQEASDRPTASDPRSREQGLLDAVFETLPIGVFVKDARDLHYVRANHASAELLDVTLAELLGRTDAQIFPSTLASEYALRDRLAVARRAPVDTPDEIVATRHRGARVVHTRRVPIMDTSGEPRYILGISEDITDRRLAQEHVRLARLEAERASRAKSEFLSRMSHEMRTPLNAVLGFAQVMAMEPNAGDHGDAVHHILKAGGHLLELIGEVLDIARIEAGHVSLVREPLATRSAVLAAVDLVRPLAAPRGITITCNAPEDDAVHVLADGQRLKQVLINLIGNAVKYNREGGCVRLTWSAASRLVRIRVEDTGPGIAPEQLPLLFQPFERLGAEQTGVEGTGLGLAVSKGLTEAMGGRIGVESERGRGTTFWVELPEADRMPARECRNPPPPARVAPMAATGVVLYVEDNRSNVRLMERLMARRGGVMLTTAGTGAAALEAAHALQPDLILLDLHLPDMRGEEVLRRLRDAEDTAGIPVAVLSADATPTHQEHLMAAGAVAYLTKPIDVAALLALLDERLSRSTPDDAVGGAEGA